LAGERPLNQLERQGLVQAFEFTHELAWNLIKDFLAAHGNTQPVYGSRDATRAGFAVHLITDGDAWMEMIASRNLTSHTYNEATAEEIERAVLTSYVACFEQLEGKMAETERSTHD